MRLSPLPQFNHASSPRFGYAMYPVAGNYTYAAPAVYASPAAYPTYYPAQTYWAPNWPQPFPAPVQPGWSPTPPPAAPEPVKSKPAQPHEDHNPPGFPGLSDRSALSWKNTTLEETTSQTQPNKGVVKPTSIPVAPNATTEPKTPILSDDPDKAQFLELAGQLYDQPEVRRLLTPEAVSKLKTALQNPLQLRHEVINILGQTPKGQEFLNRFKTAFSKSPFATKMIEKSLNWIVPAQYKDVVQGFFSQVKGPSPV
jgi:hypothetical protein